MQGDIRRRLLPVDWAWRRRGDTGAPARFESGDVVVVLGEPDALEAAEIRLLQGTK